MGLYIVQNAQVNHILDTDYNSSSKGSQYYHTEWKKLFYITHKIEFKISKYINYLSQCPYHFNSTIYMPKGFLH